MEDLELKLTEEEMTAIEDFAACNYGPTQIAIYLDVPKKTFLSVWNQTESEVRLAYERGKLKSGFIINKKQLDLATSGNITAAQIFLKEAEKNEVTNLRNKILFGDDY